MGEGQVLVRVVGERKVNWRSMLASGRVLCPLDTVGDMSVSSWIMSLGLREAGRTGD